MAAIQSRLPVPGTFKVSSGKDTTKPTITSKLRKPTIITSNITTTSQIAQPTEKQQAVKIPQETQLRSNKIASQLIQPTKISLTPAVRIVNGPTIRQNDSEISDTTSQAGSDISNVSNAPLKKPDFSNVKARIGSLENAKHKPNGGQVKVLSEKQDFSKVRSRVGSLDNVKHCPKGGDVRIFSTKADFSKTKSRIGSLDNINHVPQGGSVKIFSSKPDFKSVHSRVGSLDNIDHIPKGGDLVIFDDKLNYSNVKSRIGSLDNISHIPQGGDLLIFDDNLNFSNVKSRIGSLDNIQHVPQGGNIRIFNQKLRFRENAAPKIYVRSSNSSSNSSIFADDDRLNLIYSPVSSLSLDDVSEVHNPPPQEQHHTPKVEALPPIVENSAVEEGGGGGGEEEEEIVIEESSSIPVYMTETELSFEIHDSLQQQSKIPNEETNKHTEFSSETNSIHRVHDISGKETQHEILYEEETYDGDDYDEESQRDSTSIRESTIFVTNDSSLNDTDLSFEVNVSRKSNLLDNRNSIVEDINPAPSKEIVPTVEIPPESNNELPIDPELTIVQQRAYDESWI